MGWFPILIDIIVGWWIVLLCGGVGGIILLAIMKNNKMERKNPIASNYLDRKETSLPFGELKTWVSRYLRRFPFENRNFVQLYHFLNAGFGFISLLFLRGHKGKPFKFSIIFNRQIWVKMKNRSFIMVSSFKICNDDIYLSPLFTTHSSPSLVFMKKTRARMASILMVLQSRN